MELTTKDKLAAIAHEIGHIIFFFLENKSIDEELKADEFACKMGLSIELLGLLEKIKGLIYMTKLHRNIWNGD